MPVYCVTYDLHKGGPEAYTKLKNGLHLRDSHHAEDSVWYVDFPGTSEELMKVVAELVTKKDTVDISKVTEVTTRHGVRTYDWLRQHGVEVKKAD